MNDVQAPTWLLLITNLPGRNPTLRMRWWRALKATGAGPLRDGVYVLPISEASRHAFEEQASEIKGAGGTAHIVSFEADSPHQQAAFIALFDRTPEYQEASRDLETLKRSFPKLKENGARQRLATLRRDISAIVARDFFPAASREQMEGALADAGTCQIQCRQKDEKRVFAGALDRKTTGTDQPSFEPVSVGAWLA